MIRALCTWIHGFFPARVRFELALYEIRCSEHYALIDIRTSRLREVPRIIRNGALNAETLLGSRPVGLRR